MQRLKTFCFVCFFVVTILTYWWWVTDPKPVQNSYNLPLGVYEEDSTFDCEENVGRKFVLALSYWEHLTMAMCNFFSLVHVAKEWCAHSVFPFTRESELFGLPLPGLSAFDIFFDTDAINSQLLSKKYALPPLADFIDFIHKADRRIVFVRVAWNEPIPKDKKGFECSNNPSYDAGSKFLQTINSEAKELGVSEFSIVYYCCINPYVALTPKEIAESCKFDKTTLTVVVDEWRGHFDTVEPNNYRVMLPDLKLSHHPHVINDMFPCSKDVRSNATAYTQSFSEGKDFIAIHLRTAKVGQQGQKYVDACMKKVFALQDNLTVLYPEVPIKYFVDYGKHGMKDGNEEMQRKPVVKHIEDKKIVPLHYDPAQFGGLSDEGFVSLVEKSTIAKAKVLVLLGGGSFQLELAQRAKLEPKSDKIYCICTDYSPTESYCNSYITN